MGRVVERALRHVLPVWSARATTSFSQFTCCQIAGIDASPTAIAGIDGAAAGTVCGEPSRGVLAWDERGDSIPSSHAPTTSWPRCAFASAASPSAAVGDGAAPPLARTTGGVPWRLQCSSWATSIRRLVTYGRGRGAVRSGEVRSGLIGWPDQVGGRVEPRVARLVHAKEAFPTAADRRVNSFQPPPYHL